MSSQNLLFILLSTLFLYQCSPKFLQVHDEPMHRPVFESKKARVLDIRFPPGDTCFFHQHSENYYYVAIQGGKCFVQNQGEEGRVLTLPTGYSGGKFDMPNEQFIHRIANLDTDTIKYIAVENLRPKRKKKEERINYSIGGVQLLEDNSKFKVLKINAVAFPLSWNFKKPVLIVNLSAKDFKINNSLIEKNWSYFEKGGTFKFSAEDGFEQEIIAIEIK